MKFQAVVCVRLPVTLTVTSVLVPLYGMVWVAFPDTNPVSSSVPPS